MVSYLLFLNFFSALEKHGPTFAYFPEPSKSVLVVSETNATKAKTFFREQGFKVRLGSRYLGGYLGNEATKSTWLEERIEDWVAAVKELARIAEKFPQSAYCGLKKSLQLGGSTFKGSARKPVKLFSPFGRQFIQIIFQLYSMTTSPPTTTGYNCVSSQ